MGFIDKVRGLFSGREEKKFVSSHQQHIKNLSSAGKHISRYLLGVLARLWSSGVTKIYIVIMLRWSVSNIN